MGIFWIVRPKIAQPAADIFQPRAAVAQITNLGQKSWRCTIERGGNPSPRSRNGHRPVAKHSRGGLPGRLPRSKGRAPTDHASPPVLQGTSKPACGGARPGGWRTGRWRGPGGLLQGLVTHEAAGTGAFSASPPLSARFVACRCPYPIALGCAMVKAPLLCASKGDVMYAQRERGRRVFRASWGFPRRVGGGFCRGLKAKAVFLRFVRRACHGGDQALSLPLPGLRGIAFRAGALGRFRHSAEDSRCSAGFSARRIPRRKRAARSKYLPPRCGYRRCSAWAELVIGAVAWFGLLTPVPASTILGGIRAQHASQVRGVTPFVVYYGWIPWQRARFARLAAEIGAYPVVILGSGDEWRSGGDLGAAKRLIRVDRASQFYGYINLGVTGGQPGHSFADLRRALVAWKRMGTVGVLLDCAGPDYGVSRTRLARAVRLGHAFGLRLLVNAWNPAAVVGVGLRRTDAWLAENWAVAQGRPYPAIEENLAGLRAVERAGIPVWMTATGSRPPSRTDVFPWVAATRSRVNGVAIAVSGPDYSSRSNAVVPAAWIRQAILATQGAQSPQRRAASPALAKRASRALRPEDGDFRFPWDMRRRPPRGGI